MQSTPPRTAASGSRPVLHSLGLGAFAPGENDWADGSAGLAKLASAAAAPAIVPSMASTDPSRPFVSVAVRDLGALKVGFVGYGQPEAAGSQPPHVEDAVKKGVEEAKRQGANVLVALAAVGRGEAKRIADAVPELTAVVVGSAKSIGDANTTAPQGEQVGNVLIVEAANHLQSVAVLDLYVREALAQGHLVKFADATGLELARQREDIARRIDELHDKISAWEREKSVSDADLQARRRDLAKLEEQRDRLDERSPPAQGSFFRYAIKEVRESLGKDPAIDADMLSYYKAVNDHNRAAFADRLPAAAAPDQASYVGIDVCSSCHPGGAPGVERNEPREGLRDAFHGVQAVQSRVRGLPRHRLRQARGQHRHARGRPDRTSSARSAMDLDRSTQRSPATRPSSRARLPRRRACSAIIRRTWSSSTPWRE